MSAPRKRPVERVRPGETWQECARRLASSYSARQIAMVVGRDHTSVLYVVNPEFRRDKVRVQRRRRSEMTPAERREESLARAYRAGDRWGVLPA